MVHQVEPKHSDQGRRICRNKNATRLNVWLSACVWDGVEINNTNPVAKRFAVFLQQLFAAPMQGPLTSEEERELVASGIAAQMETAAAMAEAFDTPEAKARSMIRHDYGTEAERRDAVEFIAAMRIEEETVRAAGGIDWDQVERDEAELNAWASACDCEFCRQYPQAAQPEPSESAPVTGRLIVKHWYQITGPLAGAYDPDQYDGETEDDAFDNFCGYIHRQGGNEDPSFSRDEYTVRKVVS